MVTGGEGAVGHTSLQAGPSRLVENAGDLRQKDRAGSGDVRAALEKLPPGFRSPRLMGAGGLHLSQGFICTQGTDGSGGANEAVFPPTRRDSDGWLLGRRQVLAHGPLGRMENCTSLNVTVGLSDGWPLGRERGGSGVQ